MPRRYRASSRPTGEQAEEQDWGQICWKFVTALSLVHIVGIPILWMLSSSGTPYWYTSPEINLLTHSKTPQTYSETSFVIDADETGAVQATVKAPSSLTLARYTQKLPQRSSQVAMRGHTLSSSIFQSPTDASRGPERDVNHKANAPSANVKAHVKADAQADTVKSSPANLAEASAPHDHHNLRNMSRLERMAARQNMTKEERVQRQVAQIRQRQKKNMQKIQDRKKKRLDRIAARQRQKKASKALPHK